MVYNKTLLIKKNVEIDTIWVPSRYIFCYFFFFKICLPLGHCLRWELNGRNPFSTSNNISFHKRVKYAPDNIAIQLLLFSHSVLSYSV